MQAKKLIQCEADKTEGYKMMENMFKQKKKIK